jgi:hypothetical protein
MIFRKHLQTSALAILLFCMNPATADPQRTIAIDGVNDFLADETFLTTSTGFYSYLSWDESAAFLGMYGTDVGTGYWERYVAVYFDTRAGGTTTGIDYAGQQPTLPFAADFHFRWRVDGLDTGLFQWNGSAWEQVAWNGSVAQTGLFMEYSIPRSDLGNPTRVRMIPFMVIDNQWTFAGAPLSAFVDGPDPDFFDWLSIDLRVDAAPTEQVNGDGFDF